jgi:DNA-binding NarL/FixJ family response regulator
MIYITIVEDDQIIREELTELLNETNGNKCIGAYSNCELMLKELEDNCPDIILMDIDLPGMSGIEGIKKVKEISSKIDIVMLTVHEEADLVFNALKAGACGYLDKSAPEEKIIDAIKEVNEGGAPMTSRIAKLVVSSLQSERDNHDLSNRELEVLNSLCEGATYKEIGDKLFISVGTVRHHIKNIYYKLHVHSKAEAVAKAFKSKLI